MGHGFRVLPNILHGDGRLPWQTDWISNYGEVPTIQNNEYLQIFVDLRLLHYKKTAETKYPGPRPLTHPTRIAIPSCKARIFIQTSICYFMQWEEQVLSNVILALAISKNITCPVLWSKPDWLCCQVRTCFMLLAFQNVVIVVMAIAALQVKKKRPLWHEDENYFAMVG